MYKYKFVKIFTKECGKKCRRIRIQKRKTMEKDILIQNLRTKVGEDNCKSISDKTFEGIANVYLPMFADDSKITDETWKFPVAALTEFAGQKRYDEKVFTEKFKSDYAKEYATQHEKDVEERIRVATEKAIESYKKEHPDKDGDGGNGGNEGDEIDKKVNDAVAKALQGLRLRWRYRPRCRESTPLPAEESKPQGLTDSGSPQRSSQTAASVRPMREVPLQTQSSEPARFRSGSLQTRRYADLPESLSSFLRLQKRKARH